MQKRCTKCKILKSAEEFYKRYNNCKLCRALYIHRIKKETYDKMFSEQAGKCALDSPECSGVLCIDHSRDTVRGLLCVYHNHLVGYFEHCRKDTERLTAYISGEITKFVKTDLKYDICKIKDCEERVAGRGLCTKHYRRLKRNSDGKELEQIEAEIAANCPGPEELGL